MDEGQYILLFLATLMLALALGGGIINNAILFYAVSGDKPVQQGTDVCFDDWRLGLLLSLYKVISALSWNAENGQMLHFFIQLFIRIVD
jgi:hypothetical protein